MANHLIPNALLRPHGTNNPYNTLLGESSIYNNPLGMYNTQGVASLSLLLMSLIGGVRGGEGVDSVFVMPFRLSVIWLSWTAIHTEVT